MLAYELYLKNKDSEESAEEGVFAPYPLKKIFVRTSPLKIKLDDTTLPAYGGVTSPETKLFQESLSMPLSNQPDVGLPRRMTGSASKQPYITLYGTYAKGKITIQIRGNAKSGKRRRKAIFSFTSSVDDEEGKEDFRTDSPTLTLRLDREHYRLPGTTVFEAYRKYGVINDEGAFLPEIFLSTCRLFVDFCKKRNLATHLEGFKRNLRFELVILPYSMREQNQSVTYVEEQDEEQTEAFTDSFGTKSTSFASKTTQTAKFLSFDDKAFAINCTEGRDFYANLGIGRETLQDINLHFGDCFRISGFLWFFIDLDDPHFTFERTNAGIYDQLLRNYQQLKKKAGASLKRKSILKIICLKKTQAKLEVLLDENLTMDSLQQILLIDDLEQSNSAFPLAEAAPSGEQNQTLTEQYSHVMALEDTLILKRRGQTSAPLWADYLSGVRHLISGTPMERSVLVNTFLKILRENLLLWIKDFLKGVDSTNHFFEKSMFCMRLLTRESGRMTDMNENEEYAFRIGRIAGKYVQFKRNRGEAASSTADILTYTKYDRDKLRHVYSRVCIGVSLGMPTSGTPGNSEREILQFLEENAPQKEIGDDKAYEDYSYFFYRGVFDSRKTV